MKQSLTSTRRPLEALIHICLLYTSCQHCTYPCKPDSFVEILFQNRLTDSKKYQYYTYQEDDQNYRHFYKVCLLYTSSYHASAELSFLRISDQ